MLPNITANEICIPTYSILQTRLSLLKYRFQVENLVCLCFVTNLFFLVLCYSLDTNSLSKTMI